jgi:predicted secreted protein
MCDNKNELHDSETDDDEDETIRLELDLTATTDTYPEFDYLELVRNKQASRVRNRPSIRKICRSNRIETKFDDL